MVIMNQPTLVIGVMGVTGSGKSSFVRTASGREDVVVGHTLEACTQKITAYPFSTAGYNIILVDTPGFNDTYKSDTEILLELAQWLEITYRQNAKLTGIIYLHRITDVRMDGGAMRNLKMFRKLCGEDPMKNVVIVSTFWGVIPDEQAISHEEELCSKDDFWGDMIEHGASVKRFSGDQKSALEILLSLARKPAVTLDIQRELVDEAKPIGKTAAGNAVNEELHRLEEKYKVEIKKFQEETAAAMAEKDVELERVLKKEREKMERKLDRIHGDQELLRKERREEMRRVEEENERRYQLLKKEYDSKLEKQHLVSERTRAEDRANFRESMGNLQNQNAALSSTFKEQMRDLQSANEAAVAAAAAAAQQPERNVGGKFANLLVSGTLAVLDPLAIPVALASLVDLINEL